MTVTTKFPLRKTVRIRTASGTISLYKMQLAYRFCGTKTARFRRGWNKNFKMKNGTPKRYVLVTPRRTVFMPHKRYKKLAATFL